MTTHEPLTMAHHIAEVAAEQVTDLVDRDAALDEVLKISGKAAILRLALNQINERDVDLTWPMIHGLLAITDEIENSAWSLARVQFEEEWQRRFASKRNEVRT